LISGHGSLCCVEIILDSEKPGSKGTGIDDSYDSQNANKTNFCSLHTAILNWRAVA
jgi:hypothetical protein